MAEAEGKFELVTDVGMTNGELASAICGVGKMLSEPAAINDTSLYWRLSNHLDALLVVQRRRAEVVRLTADSGALPVRVDHDDLTTIWRAPEAPGRGGAGPSGETGHG